MASPEARPIESTPIKVWFVGTTESYRSLLTNFLRSYREAQQNHRHFTDIPITPDDGFSQQARKFLSAAKARGKFKVQCRVLHTHT